MKYIHKCNIPFLSLLILAGTLPFESAYAQTSSLFQKSDFCFMRTAEGEYISLNELCQSSSSNGPARATSSNGSTRTTDENTVPQGSPIPTSTPAQTPSSPTQSVSPEDSPFSSDNQDPVVDDVPNDMPRDEARSDEDPDILNDSTDAVGAPVSEPATPFPRDNAVPELNGSPVDRVEPSGSLDNSGNMPMNQDLPNLNESF